MKETSKNQKKGKKVESSWAQIQRGKYTKSTCNAFIFFAAGVLKYKKQLYYIPNLLLLKNVFK